MTTELNYPFKGMIFEGGGSLGTAHIGAIKVFENKGILDQIEYFVGSSAGAIMAGGLACGIKTKLLEEILIKSDFNNFKDDSFGVIRDLNRFIRNFGWYRGDRLEEWYGGVLNQICGNSEITFKEAHQRFGKVLVITVTDINLGKTVYLSHSTVPDMKIKKAVRRSSIMPLVFQTDSEDINTKVFTDDGVKTKMIKHVFTDGGLLNNYPIKHLDDRLKFEEVIGFRLMTTLELEELKIPDLQSDQKPPSNVVDYIFILYDILRNQALKIHVDSEDWKRTVKIDVKNMSATDFNLSDQDKLFLLNQGKTAAEKFLNQFELETLVGTKKEKKKNREKPIKKNSGRKRKVKKKDNKLGKLKSFDN